MARLLIAAGTLLVLAGLLWPFLKRLGLGRLPGDIALKTEHLRIFLPVASSLLVSLILSLAITLLFWFLKR